MLTKTERISNKSVTQTTETLEELLARFGVMKVKSYPCTPNVTAKTAIEEPKELKL